MLRNWHLEIESTRNKEDIVLDVVRAAIVGPGFVGLIFENIVDEEDTQPDVV